MKVLKNQGCIEKIGYGVWKYIKEVKQIGLGHSNFKSIRSHAFGFYLAIPTISNWKQRQNFLKNNNIKYKKGNLININSQTFIYKDWHITLFNKGIKFQAVKGKHEIRTNSATLSVEMATRIILEVIRALEGLFGVSLSINKQYKLRISRQHHALVKNELAEIYRKRKLKVYDERGLWLLVDFSLNVDELETVRGSEADSHMDNVVKPFFNSLKEKPFTAYDFSEVHETLKKYATQMDLHLEVEQGTLEQQKRNNQIQEETLKTMKAIQGSLIKPIKRKHTPLREYTG